LNADAFYFSNASGVQQLVENVQRKDTERLMVRNNVKKIQYQFSWEKVIEEYESFILECYDNLNYERVITRQR